VRGLRALTKSSILKRSIIIDGHKTSVSLEDAFRGDLKEIAAHQPIYERLKQVRALERLQTLLSPLRLPRPLLLKVSGCDGVSNAWYDEGFVTVCYEFLADLLKNALERTLPSIITQDDAILGPFMEVFLHETGHAVFDRLHHAAFGQGGRAQADLG
jgi:hypothetical protein